MKKGQSILEVIIAVSIIVIIAASSVTAVLGAFSSTRLAEEETQAALYAFEGMEAVQSIRNQGWGNLANGPHGLTNASGVWAFSGTSDIDPTGKFERVATLSDVRRNLSGDIVTGNGLLDEDTKSLNVQVSWNFTPGRRNTVAYSTYITNWQIAVDPGTATGGPTTCAEYCQGSGYATGVCRNNANQCTQNGEVNLVGGNQFCSNTCCCGN